MTTSLAELRDALTVFGVSTATDGLRGEQRRLELAARLRAARVRLDPSLQHCVAADSDLPRLRPKAGIDGQGETDNADDAAFSSRLIDRYQHMALSELRQVLEQRGQSTQTLGLKGDARRHALVQRLVNTHNGGLQHHHRAVHAVVCSSAQLQHNSTDRYSEGGETGRVEDEDANSVSSSSSYSVASEFFFFDLPSGRASECGVAGTSSSCDGSDDKPAKSDSLYQSVPHVPTLNLTGSHQLKTTSSFFSSDLTDNQDVSTTREYQDNQQPPNKLRDELFEARKQLHQLREQRHRVIDERMHSAGFTDSLESLSRLIEAVERERGRLTTSHFGHELVTVARRTLFACGATPSDTLELVQTDAVWLLDKRQETLRRLVERTKEAVEITKRGLRDDECHRTMSGDLEATLCMRIEQINETLLQQAQASARSLDSIAHLSWRSVVSSVSACPPDAKYELPVLTRCRSLPSAMFKQTWADLEPEQKTQLCIELRTAASRRIQRGRVALGGLFGSLTSRSSLPTPATVNDAVGVSPTSSAPSRADRLGVKALFLELTKRSVHETSRAYQQAIALDRMHATNLGNYARFLCVACGNVEMAQDHFNRALRADPLHAQNIIKYATFLKRARHDMAAAEQCYLQALRLAPNDLDALGGYASLLVKKHDVADKQRAKELLKRALQIAPRHVKLQLQYAAALAAVGDFDAAERCYEQLVEGVKLRELSRPSGRTREHGNGCVQQRNDDAFVRVDAVDKEYAHVFGNYANFLRRRGRLADAKQMYAKALALHPSHPLLLRNLCVWVCR